MNPFIVNTAGSAMPLRCISYDSRCRQIQHGVAFEFGDEGVWVVALEDLEKIVTEAKAFQAERAKKKAAV